VRHLLTVVAAAAALAARAPTPPSLALRPDAVVTVVVAYPACAVRREGRGPLPPGLAGLAEPEVRALVAPDRVVAFSATALVLERSLPGCPKDTVTLGVRDGEVVVRAGRPGDLGPVVQRTGIPARALPPAERARLENGRVVAAADLPAALGALRGEAGLSTTRA
jgi:hypothetical protein